MVKLSKEGSDWCEKVSGYFKSIFKVLHQTKCLFVLKFNISQMTFNPTLQIRA